MTDMTRSRELLLNGKRVARVHLADTFVTRFRGMLWRRTLPEALLLTPCASVHGAGMRVTLDYALLAADGAVLRIGTLRPWGLSARAQGTVSVLEAPEGNFSHWGMAEGARVTLVEA